jgi:hypothetical protein
VSPESESRKRRDQPRSFLWSSCQRISVLALRNRRCLRRIWHQGDGIRDRLTWISTACWVTLTVCACGAWMPYALYAIPIVLSAGVTALLSFRATRRPFLCVLAASASYAATSALFFILSRGTSIPLNATGNPENVIFVLGASLTSVGIEAVVLARLRRVTSHMIAK